MTTAARKVMLQCDLSQAESRVVFALSGDARLIELARAKPWDYDAHTENARVLFRKRDVTKDERQIGKVVSHGAQRGMGGRKLAGSVLKHLGVALTERECDRFIERYLATYPGIESYFATIRKDVMRHRALMNTWGRQITWDYDALEDSLYREAYSWLPQSEVGQLMNEWGFLALDAQLQAGRWPGAAINNLGHDSLLASVWPRQAYEIALYLRDSLERPRVYRGCELSIPLEYQLGRNWQMQTDFKRLPERDEFTAAAEALAA